jgi:hypothetical protein
MALKSSNERSGMRAVPRKYHGRKEAQKAQTKACISGK